MVRKLILVPKIPLSFVVYYSYNIEIYDLEGPQRTELFQMIHAKSRV